jgi:hypothetical protein
MHLLFLFRVDVEQSSCCSLSMPEKRLVGHAKQCRTMVELRQSTDAMKGCGREDEAQVERIESSRAGV